MRHDIHLSRVIGDGMLATAEAGRPLDERGELNTFDFSDGGESAG